MPRPQAQNKDLSHPVPAVDSGGRCPATKAARSHDGSHARATAAARFSRPGGGSSVGGRTAAAPDLGVGLTEQPGRGGDAVPAGNVARILAALAANPDADPDRVSLPQRLCTACAAALPVSGVGLALMSSEGPAGLVGASDGPAWKMEELQFTLGEGPCVDASWQGRPVLQPQLRRTAPSRWPGFGPAALDAGIEAIFAFPLQVGAIRLGVLDLYRDTPGALTNAQGREALGYADAAIWVLLHLQDQVPLDRGLHPDLSDFDQNLATVHQATGMVAVQAAVGLTEALLLLRAHAYSTGHSINDIAHDVLNRTLHFTPDLDNDDDG